MSTQQVRAKAFTLRSEQFQMVNNIKDLQLADHVSRLSADDALADGFLSEQGQLDKVACKLAGLYDHLPLVFVTAAAE